MIPIHLMHNLPVRSLQNNILAKNKHRTKTTNNNKSKITVDKDEKYVIDKIDTITLYDGDGIEQIVLVNKDGTFHSIAEIIKTNDGNIKTETKMIDT